MWGGGGGAKRFGALKVVANFMKICRGLWPFMWACKMQGPANKESGKSDEKSDNELETGLI